MIPYARHLVDDDDIAAVAAVLRSDRLTQGPIVAEFEATVAEAAGTRFAVATSNGTTALWCALRAWRLLDPDALALRVSPLTFVATVAAAYQAGWAIQFADIDAETLCLNVDDGDANRSVGVDYAGYAASGSPLLVDAAHSFGGRKGHSACFSFHPAKTITTAEGGAFVTDDAVWADSARSLRDHGRVNGTATAVGTNARMSDVHAALGLSQIRKLERFLDRRRQIVQVYMGELNGLPLRLPHTRAPHAWHLFVVRVPARRREAFRQALADHGVGTQVHYRLVYDHPAFAWLRPMAGCPIAERAASEVVSLPLFPAMTDDEVARVVDGVRVACPAVL